MLEEGLLLSGSFTPIYFSLQANQDFVKKIFVSTNFAAENPRKNRFAAKKIE